MPYPLLTTKLYMPPARPNLVRRPRLTARLGEGLRLPLTLISSPAGFGKTTLLSEWRATAEGQAAVVAWVSLDAADNDPGRFWSYVMASLRTLPGLAGLPADLEADAPPEQLLAPLINGLEAAGGPCVLVLDDYHAIESPVVHGAVSFLVEHLPPGLRMVILTRADPPWPLARLRANGRMSELREADLRFTPAEVAEFLTRAAGLELTAADVAALEQQTEGWIAALQMAAISLDGHPDPHGFIAGFSGENRYIADYLAEEVLIRQPEPLRRFLLQVSLLDRLSAPLCEAVTGSPDSRIWLEEAERKGLFLVPLDASRRWFRFHHLFGDLLRTRLHQGQPDLVPELHSRASAWYAANGQTIEAANHSLAARDYDRAADLYEQYAGGWWAYGHPMFFDLLQKFPQEVWARRPAFCTYQAWFNCVTGRLEAASALLEIADRHSAVPPETKSFQAVMRAYIAELSGNPSGEDLLPPDYIPEENASVRNSAEMMLAFIHQMNGRLDEAADLLAQAARRDAAGRSTNSIPVAIPRLARIRLIQGRAAEAEALCRRSIATIQERGAARFYIRGNLNAVLADALRLQGDLEAAAEQAEEGVRCNEQWPIPLGIAMAAQALARVRSALGDARGALDLLEQEEAATRDRAIQPDLVSERTALRVQAWLALGDVETAERWAARSGLTAHDPLSFRRETEHIALARVLLATGRTAEGGALAARLAAAARAAGRLGRLEEIPNPADVARAPELLSEREREILALLVAGCSNHEIADRLIVAVGTVKVHVHNIFQKLEAASRTQAVARARELGLLK